MSDRDPLALPDLDEAAPAGENLEFDPDFGALEQAAQGKPETQQGDPAVPPDWKEAEALARGLLGRTRDLRILVHLATARLQRAGLPGFAEVLTQIRDQVANRWPAVHPQLDPDDDLDPTLRSNALFALNDPARVLPGLRNVAMATSRETGPVLWRDIAGFLGQLPPDPARPKLTEAAIRGAFAKTDPERLAALRAAVARALAELDAIAAAFNAQAGPGRAPDFTPLRKLLRDMEQGLERFEPPPADSPAADLPADEAPAEETSMAAPEAGTSPPPSARGAMSIRSITAVSRRDDALYLLDLAAAYFRANEPSSPLPLLIDRARRLATMEFLDILRDIAPNGLGQAQIVAGPLPEETPE